MDEKIDCTSCIYFRSFKDDYFDDMEPDDQGFCKNPDGKYFFNEGAGAGRSCEHHLGKLTEQPDIVMDEKMKEQKPKKRKRNKRRKKEADLEREQDTGHCNWDYLRSY